MYITLSCSNAQTNINTLLPFFNTLNISYWQIFILIQKKNLVKKKFFLFFVFRLRLLDRVLQ